MKGPETRQNHSIKSFIGKDPDSALPSVGTSAGSSVQSLALVALSKQHVLQGRKGGWCELVPCSERTCRVA